MEEEAISKTILSLVNDKILVLNTHMHHCNYIIYTQQRIGS